GTATTLSNSQCTVNVGQSSSSGSGNVLTVNLALSFNSSFAGSKNTYAYVKDRADNASGWQAVGTWTVVAGINPTVAGVTPSSGSGSSQTFSFRYSSGGGFGNIVESFQLFNSALVDANGCSTFYWAGTDSIYLNNDAGNGWGAPAKLGTATTLSNSQCTVNVGQSSSSGSGNVLT